jgi:DmsE family decaheme c-type cytochrome
MKNFSKLLAAGVLLASLFAAPAWAQDTKLPDLTAGASKSALAQEALKKDAVCTKCHDESETAPVLSIYQTKHGLRGDPRTPTCQSCHGASDKHVLGDPAVKGRAAPDIVFKKGAFAASSTQAQGEACIGCHKAGKRSHWEGSQHQSRDVACSSCHAVHVKTDPVLAKRTQAEVCFSCHKSERAQSHRNSTHPLDAGKMACSDCHNPHGTTGPKLLSKNNVNDTCYTCHAEKRGPFLWEHAPVTDDCTNCHTPHGSVNAPLLKAPAPYLCQQCHSGDHGSSVRSSFGLAKGNLTTVNGAQAPGNQAPNAQTAGRACLNCHMVVHGSNHPAGAKFQR